MVHGHGPLYVGFFTNVCLLVDFSQLSMMKAYEDGRVSTLAAYSSPCFFHACSATGNHNEKTPGKYGLTDSVVTSIVRSSTALIPNSLTSLDPSDTAFQFLIPAAKL